jgi:AcrR family transcriptional regulator
MKRELRIKARQLRSEGRSVGEIAAMLGVAKSSVSYWVRDITLTDAQVERLLENKRNNKGRLRGAHRNREKFRQLRLTYQEAGRAAARQGRLLHMAGCMLYWAEGSKDRNTLYFVNSDAHMLQMFMRFLREELCVPEESITIRIHCHSEDPLRQKQVENYWLATLGLPEASLRKTLYKKGSEIVHNVLANGVCAIRVNSSTKYVQHIYGAIQEYGGFDNPDWLF